MHDVYLSNESFLGVYDVNISIVTMWCPQKVDYIYVTSRVVSHLMYMIQILLFLSEFHFCLSNPRLYPNWPPCVHMYVGYLLNSEIT